MKIGAAIARRSSRGGVGHFPICDGIEVFSIDKRL